MKALYIMEGKKIEFTSVIKNERKKQNIMCMIEERKLNFLPYKVKQNIKKYKRKKDI